MNIKMILTDLDYTLLRSDGSISDYTKQILKKCQSYGILVVIATARYRNAPNLWHRGCCFQCRYGC